MIMYGSLSKFFITSCGLANLDGDDKMVEKSNVLADLVMYEWCAVSPRSDPSLRISHRKNPMFTMLKLYIAVNKIEAIAAQMQALCKSRGLWQNFIGSSQ